jgi:hypothetical protein
MGKVRLSQGAGASADGRIQDNAVAQCTSEVQTIMHRANSAEDGVRDLERAISLLQKQQPLEEFEAFLVGSSLPQVATNTWKRARNLCEDLLEAQLALDTLSGLSDSDRALRKRSIAMIDSLLDRVEVAKNASAMLMKRTENVECLDVSASCQKEPEVEKEDSIGVVMSQALKLKAEFGGDIRRYDLVPQGLLTVSHISKVVVHLFELDDSAGSSIKLTFKDDAGQLRALSDDTLRCAMSFANRSGLLRLVVSKCDP